MKHSLFYLAACLIAGTTIISSCSDDTSVDDKPLWTQTQAEKTYVAAFDSILGSVNSGQDWTTVRVLNAKVSVNLGQVTDYKVAIYNRNPLTTDASLLAIGTVTEGQTANLYFDAPYSQTHFFVALFDASGGVLVENAGLTNGALVVNFGNTSGKKAPRRATEVEAVAYARTANDFLKPVIQGVRVVAVTEDAMQAYPTITNDSLVNDTLGGKLYRVDADTEITETFFINGDDSIVNDAVVYVQGRLHLKNDTIKAITFVVADGGELIIDVPECNVGSSGRLVVLAGGKVASSVSGATLNIDNGQWNYNAGLIAFNGTLNINGSIFYNCGRVETDIVTATTDGSSFTNFGSVVARTNHVEEDSCQCHYVNACYLQFTEDAALGGIVMLNNSRVDVGRNALFNGTNQMGNASAIVVAGKTVIHPNTVFEGPTENGSFAILKPNIIQVAEIGNGDIKNNIYLDWVESEYYDSDGNKYDMTSRWSDGYLFLNRIEHWVMENMAPAFISIEASECTGAGYHVAEEGATETTPVSPWTTPSYFTIAFESLGPNPDYDFNDVVLYVERDVQTNKANVQLMAVGDTLPVTVKYNGETIITKNDSRAINATGFRSVIETASDINFSDAILDLRKFSVEFDYSGSPVVVTSSNVKGCAPQALIIPGKWSWPSEGTGVTSAYPHFSEWMSGLNDNGWYTAPVAGKVITAE